MSQFVHAYNSTRNDASGFSPYYVMFGREARLPVDVCFDTDEHEVVSHSRYIEELMKDLQTVYELAARSAMQVYLRNKQNHERVLRDQLLAKSD